jgi:NAD+ synthase (glutamine-hydrolysing)
MHGFLRLAAAVPDVRVADVNHNVEQIVALTRMAADDDVALAVFPELSITGYTCADLFFQSRLTDTAFEALDRIAQETKSCDTIIVVGAPLYHGNRLYNCGIVMQSGLVRGVVPKSFLPNYKEFYEKRWFTPGADVFDEWIRLNGEKVPFGVDLVFAGEHNLVLGVEICEDLWNVVPPSSRLAQAGATVIANLSASNELVGKADYRRDLVRGQSARCVAAYVYSGAGPGESTTDVVFGGHGLIAENGIVLAETARFTASNELLCGDVDCERLRATRVSETVMPDNDAFGVRVIELSSLSIPSVLRREVTPLPFVPSEPSIRDERCHEIFSIQSCGLAKRLEHTNAHTVVIGVSGGLDSTLALLVARAAFERLGHDLDRIIAVTMPGFGTSKRTFTNAVSLCRSIGAEVREIDIVPACLQHFADIGHDPEQYDITYENVQARERMQLLMDIANREGGLVVGTGDLSELALGWCTYNGDHMSMYAVNSGVPKTLIQYLVRWVADQNSTEVRDVLLDILDTPITPELLPAHENGEIAQKTEELIGPYELHDFFLYHTVKYGARPRKIGFLAEHAFDGKYTPKEIKRWLDLFVKRFFSQQFKRSCIPDGPKVGTISLSPRGAWRMPSDAVDDLWRDDI